MDRHEYDTGFGADWPNRAAPAMPNLNMFGLVNQYASMPTPVVYAFLADELARRPFLAQETVWNVLPPTCARSTQAYGTRNHFYE